MPVHEFIVVTIFPELFESFTKTSLIGKAIKARTLGVKLVDLRDYAKDKHRSVDDTPYGGGCGMVMKPEPILDMLDDMPPCHRVLLSPQGRPLDQSAAKELASRSPLLLFCGRYEGVDERARCEFDEEISLGDFVLNGGEVAAMAVMEAVGRLVPGVIGKAESTTEESFSDGLLEYPQYTRPEVIKGRSVPQVLLSGHHERVAQWRRGQSLMRTKRRRPDLWSALELSPSDRALLALVEEESPEENGDGTCRSKPTSR